MAEDALSKHHPVLAAEGWRLIEVILDDGPVLIMRCTTPLPQFATAVIKMIKAGAPSSTVTRLRSESEIFELLRHCPHVMRWIGFTESPPCLFGEDAQTTHLSTLMPFTKRKGVFTLAEKIDILLGVARGVDAIHRAGVLHNTLSPTAVNLNLRLHRVMVGGFHRAARVPLPSHGTAYAGLPAYMAPEHSGRINATVDFRSDLYSLGMLFYEICAEAYPLPLAPNSVDWVPAHMAKIMPPAAEVAPALVPPLISEMTAIMLRKDKADRYQSAHGIERDLSRFHDEMEAGVDPFAIRFPLRLYDRAASFTPPSQLFGRDKELGQLMELFSQALEGVDNIVYIASPSGMGKTALAEHFQRLSVARHRNVVFVSAKCDAAHRNVPYYCCRLFFESLVESVLSKGTHFVTELQQDLRLGMDPRSLAALIELIPSMERILGPPDVSLGELDAESRKTLLQNGLAAIMSGYNNPDRPLVLMLEDFHFMDPESMELNAKMMSKHALKYLLNVNLFRADKPSDHQILQAYVNHPAKSGRRSVLLELGPLSEEHVRRLVGGMMNVPSAKLNEDVRLAALAGLIGRISKGSPFHAVELMETCLAEKLIQYDYDAHCFVYDIEKITARLDPNDDVAEIVAARLAHLPAEITCMLTRAACLGMNFDVSLLAHVCGGIANVGEVRAWLRLAEEQGIVRNCSLPPGALVESSPAARAMIASAAGDSETRFAFRHMRLHAACLARHPELVGETHVAVARYHLRDALELPAVATATNTTLEQRISALPSTAIFGATEHLDAALRAATAQELEQSSGSGGAGGERLEKSGGSASNSSLSLTDSNPLLNAFYPCGLTPDVLLTTVAVAMVAIELSKKTLSLAAARVHLRTAQSALARLGDIRGHAIWRTHYAEAFAVAKARVDIDNDDHQLERALEHVTAPMERSEMLLIKARAMVRDFKMLPALGYCRRSIALLGFPIPEDPDLPAAVKALQDETFERLEKMGVEEAFNRPHVGDRLVSQQVAEICRTTAFAAYFTSADMMAYIAVLALKLALDSGIELRYCYPITLNATGLLVRGKAALATQLGNQAVLAEERLGATRHSTETYLNTVNQTAHFGLPLVSLAKAYSDMFTEMMNLLNRHAGLGGCVTLYCRSRILMGSNFALWMGGDLFRSMVAATVETSHVVASKTMRVTLRVMYEMMHGSNWYDVLSREFPAIISPTGRLHIENNAIADFELTLDAPWSRAWFYNLHGLHLLVQGKFAEAYTVAIRGKRDTVRENVDLGSIVANFVIAMAASEHLIAATAKDAKEEDRLSEEQLSHVREMLAVTMDALERVKDLSPHNYTCFYLLALANQRVALEGSSIDIINMYEQAVALATQGHHHHVILFSHRALARLWRANGGAVGLRYAAVEEDLAATALSEWGCLGAGVRRSPSNGGVVVIDTSHVHMQMQSAMGGGGSVINLATSGGVSASSSAGSAHSEGGLLRARQRAEERAAQQVESAASAHLDAVSILRASRAISSELHLPKLMQKLNQILMESVGAQAIAILRPGTEADGSNSFVLDAAMGMDATHADSRVPPIVNLTPEAKIRPEDVPFSLINACVALGAPVVVNDARTDSRCAGDPHVMRFQPISLMVAPLLSRGRLLRVVIVQNNLVTGAFSPRRLAVFEGLASQAAVSIENAFLYTQLEGEKVTMEATRDAAVKADKAKSEFLAMIAHEIRTPMNGIMSMVTLLKSTELANQYSDHLDIMGTSGEILLHLINSVLDFSSLESGRFEIKSEPLNIAQCLMACSKLARTAASAKGLEMILIEGRVPLQVIGDAVRLRQIAINLTTNAIKYTEKGSVTLTYSGQVLPGDPTHPDQYELHMLVHDTGVGISKENLAKLFRPFTQVDSSARRRVDGVGLGLAITQTLAARMGGRVWVESTLGKGSTFHCTLVFGMDSSSTASAIGGSSDAGLLPIERLGGMTRQASNPLLAAAAAKAMAADVIPPTEAPLRKPAELRILIVDDNAINQKVLGKLLTKIGYTQFATASNGRDAVAAVRDTSMPFDVILMDVFMPEMDGTQATVLIRAIPEIRQPVIYAVTASALEGDRERFIEHGMNDYLCKPIQIDVLTHMLGLVLNREAQNDPI